MKDWNPLRLNIYAHQDMERMKATALKIINLLSSDYEEAIDTICFVTDRMVDDKEDFILRYRAMKIKD